MRTINGSILRIYEIPEKLLQSNNWRNHQIDLEKPVLECPVINFQIYHEYVYEPIFRLEYIDVQPRSKKLYVKKFITAEFPVMSDVVHDILNLSYGARYIVAINDIICSCGLADRHCDSLKFNILEIQKCFTADKKTLLPNVGIDRKELTTATNNN